MPHAEAAPKRSRRSSAPSAPKGRAAHLGEALTPIVEAESAATGETVDAIVRRRVERDYRNNPKAPSGRPSTKPITRPLPSPESFAAVPSPEATIANVAKAASPADA